MDEFNEKILINAAEQMERSVEDIIRVVNRTTSSSKRANLITSELRKSFKYFLDFQVRIEENDKFKTLIKEENKL